MILHHGEMHAGAHNAKLNWLRAGVLGANDGIVSIAALVVGVAAASPDIAPIFIAGMAGVAAGSISMGLGEYVSVSSQRDSELAMIAKEKDELQTQPDIELAELAGIYEKRGLSSGTAMLVAQEMTTRDAVGAHLEAELNLREQHIANPMHAAISSAVSFLAGAILPLLSVLLVSAEWRIPATIIASLVALALTGGMGAYLGGSPLTRAVVRVSIGGSLALAITWGIGSLLGGVAI
ncbi:VIT1/CCC1 family predicted Fe2+/Mn2+ transporter [Microbacteriaceae bacterium MWH-Ta3]|nr:VIT1/CCC1 family predicted Fe2+/Mn2+ transporter [Microbacteriaceae bacterium MWH-Ta3]